jgi:hypothetical protein
MIQMNESNKKGRPRVKVNYDTVKALSENGYGCKRIAKIITENGNYISASTVSRILRGGSCSYPYQAIDIKNI